MRINLDELHYRIKTDYSFKKRLRKIVIIGRFGVLFLGFITVFASSFILQDTTIILTPLAGGTNVNVMQNLVANYFNQLSNNPNINFQYFQRFITTVKNLVLDKQTTNKKLELVELVLVN